ncbi:MAG: SGNH/GDSL hydrolase family protein [Kiritimatiellia bacterium]
MSAAPANSAKKLALLAGATLAAGILLEGACQALYALGVAPQLAAQRNDPTHYYEASDDPTLAYRLKPGCQIAKDGRAIRINRHGFRDDRDDLDGAPRVALLGDSVPFGIALSQDQTPAAALQRLAGAEVRVLNFGVPGYGLEELRRHAEHVLARFRPVRVYYVLNLNDFSVRGTASEGGDNGLYRMYAPPALKTPFFLRKAIYRFMKGGRMSSVRWYRWLYEGNRAKLLPVVREMADHARAQGGEFAVVLFPPAVAYGADGTFALQAVFDEIAGDLRANQIAVLAPVAEFGADVRALQDGTDHLTAAGSEVLARIVWQDLAEK